MECHKALLEYGMQLADPNQDNIASYEVSYNKRNSLLYIELHKTLFPPDSKAYGDFNRFFEEMRKHTVMIPIDGTQILTLGYTDHLFYLICHAFKHFLHSGFGIRQVCDIVLFANRYGKEIDWQRLLKQCREIRADLFAAALFQIGEKKLIFNPKKAGYPSVWSEIQIDETGLLEDLLDAGAFGDSNMGRKHSSMVTLNEFADEKQGKQAKNGTVKALFPSVKELKGRYSYLQKHPYLLPAAWVERILKYRKEIKKIEQVSPVQIGTQRIELMRQYGILNSKTERKQKKSK